MSGFVDTKQRATPGEPLRDTRFSLREGFTRVATWSSSLRPTGTSADGYNDYYP